MTCALNVVRHSDTKRTGSTTFEVANPYISPARFRKPNRFGYAPDGYILHIMAKDPVSDPPTLKGDSPCFSGDLPDNRSRQVGVVDVKSVGRSRVRQSDPPVVAVVSRNAAARMTPLVAGFIRCHLRSFLLLRRALRGLKGRYQRSRACQRTLTRSPVTSTLLRSSYRSDPFVPQ
jgi:hypothetical protein